MSRTKDTHLKQVQNLSLPLSRLKGVGPKRAEALALKGLHTILDLLFFTPLRYEDRSRITPIRDAGPDEQVLVRGRVLSGGEEKFFPSRKRLFKILLMDQESGLELIWFQYKAPYLTALAKRGTRLLAYGKITAGRGRRQMIHPDITVLKKEDDRSGPEGPGHYPVYPAVKGMSGGRLRTLVAEAMENHLTDLIDPLPARLAHELGLPDLAGAIRSVHRPPPDTAIEALNRFDTPFHRRLVFDRFFLVMLTVAFRKRARERQTPPVLSRPSRFRRDLETLFPFPLTPGQIRAVEEIAGDLSAHRPMNRLLLGDVGCGKTAVAAAAAYIAVRNGMQAAFMVPTQILAKQHLDFFSSLPGEAGIRPFLLTGGLNRRERDAAYRKIKRGDFNVILGTHSLIQEGLAFSNLGLVVIDEQHRFGVRERALMDRKGNHPHQLVMSATPIPRTLAMTLYGDLDISVIRGYPAGRRPVTTHLMREEDKRRVFEEVRRRMSAGQQVFVICPVIEGSEEKDLKNAVQMAAGLKRAYSPDFRTGLVHGRLAPEKREAVMADFRNGRIHLLVGTTVVEVGVHVPRATVMVIEHPERFGLAQLHQLRGRVGRGRERGVCFLMAPRALSDRARDRLHVLVENHDGFRIAEKDLEQRGQGEFIGLKQAGMGEIDLPDILRHEDLLIQARETARRFTEMDPELALPENALLRGFVESVLSGPLDL